MDERTDGLIRHRGGAGRLELAKETSQLAHLLQEMKELHINASVELHRRVQTDDRVSRAESEQKKMTKRLTRVEEERSLLFGQLAKALEDRALAEEELRKEHERSSQLFGELTILQK